MVWGPLDAARPEKVTMTPDDDLAAWFAGERDRLRAIAQRMLGSTAEADDALQEAWLRARRTDPAAVANPAAWLTTVTSRVCLDRLRTRRRRAETPLAAAGDRTGPPPDEDVLLAEEIGRALLVVLDRLTPAQRVAFVLHDLFAVPFDEVAVVVDRSVVATKKLASRARDRVRGPAPTVPVPDDHAAVVAAFLAAARGGDLDALLALLAPDVVRRSDRHAVPAGVPAVVRGATAVAEETAVFVARAAQAEVALVDGVPGLVVAPAGRLEVVLRVVVAGGRVTALEVVGEPGALAGIALGVAPV
jgi:RNA polymerase sigma-70 factor (ECF subfamily)